ncbi:MAG: GFA family protein [Xanthomonadales bacterium]|nr:GFA family protein [Xanthomonadales bacterium]
MTKIIQHSGGCHCGKIRFKVTAAAAIKAVKCNCSICSQSGFLHLIVSAENFELLSGKNSLTNYQFNSKTAHHLFCKHCGVKSFYIPRSHPSGYSVNINCLDPETIHSISIEDFDGENWEDSISSLIS